MEVKNQTQPVTCIRPASGKLQEKIQQLWLRSVKWRNCDISSCFVDGVSPHLWEEPELQLLFLAFAPWNLSDSGFFVQTNIVVHDL